MLIPLDEVRDPSSSLLAEDEPEEAAEVELQLDVGDGQLVANQKLLAIEVGVKNFKFVQQLSGHPLSLSELNRHEPEDRNH